MTDRPHSSRSTPNKRARPDRNGGGRARPHARTVHDLDPRVAAFETLRRTQPGELLEPAVQATLRYMGYGTDVAHRVLPMLEDTARFSLLFDHLISHLASRKPSELDPDVRAALHLFLAWYLLDDPTSAYAHGNAAVNLLTQDHKGRGFVNALVRRLGEFVKVEQTEPEDYRALIAANKSPTLWANRARLGAGRMLVAERAIFPDPTIDLAAHLSIVGSLPRWLVERLIDQHGPDAATQICISCVERPCTWLRPNSLRTDWKEIAEWWTRSGTAVEHCPTPFQDDALVLPAKLKNLTEHPGWASGAFYVQDYSAQLVAPALEPKPEETLLDMCSAPGGKAGHLAELTNDHARILSCDVSMPKVEVIQQNIARMGYRSIATVQADASDVKFPEPFDRVLVDAPCSNSGVLARRVEARHRINEANLKELNALQLKILENAAANLKPGGALVYSVCSILLDEGPDVVHRFLRGKIRDKRREDLGWEVEYENYTLPVPAFHDGGYVARLRAPS